MRTKIINFDIKLSELMNTHRYHHSEPLKILKIIFPRVTEFWTKNFLKDFTRDKKSSRIEIFESRFHELTRRRRRSLKALLFYFLSHSTADKRFQWENAKRTKEFRRKCWNSRIIIQQGTHIREMTSRQQQQDSKNIFEW